jgi:hypothetical protein
MMYNKKNNFNVSTNIMCTIRIFTLLILLISYLQVNAILDKDLDVNFFNYSNKEMLLSNKVLHSPNKKVYTLDSIGSKSKDTNISDDIGGIKEYDNNTKKDEIEELVTRWSVWIKLFLLFCILVDLLPMLKRLYV